MRNFIRVLFFLISVSNLSYSKALESKNYEGSVKILKDLTIGTEIWNSKKIKMTVQKEFSGVQTVKDRQVYCRVWKFPNDEGFDVVLKNGLALDVEIDRFLWKPDGLVFKYKKNDTEYTFNFDCGYQSKELGWERMDADLELYTDLVGDQFDFSQIRKKPAKILE